MKLWIDTANVTDIKGHLAWLISLWTYRDPEVSTAKCFPGLMRELPDLEMMRWLESLAREFVRFGVGVLITL